LGYPTWQEYVQKEFNLSRSRSYQLLDRARVQQALSAAGVGAASLAGTPMEHFPGETVKKEFNLPQVEAPSFNMSARAVQNLKPQLPQAVGDVKKLVQDGVPIEHAVQTVIDQYGKPIDREDVMEVVEQQEEKQVRLPGHEVKVLRLRDAIVALSQLSRESRYTLALLLEDAMGLNDRPLTREHLRRISRLLANLGF
jgi:hypothetical protein